MILFKKRIFERILIAIAIWIGFICSVFFAIVLFQFIQASQLLGIPECATGAEAWMDLNGDGIKDSGEKPLAGVCIWVNSDLQNPHNDIYDDLACQSPVEFTDTDGEWSSGFFSCNFDNIYVASRPPIGFKPTTPLMAIPNSSALSFGFVSMSVHASSEIKDIEFYADSFQKQLDTKALKDEIIMIIGLVVLAVISWVVSKRFVTI